MTPTSWTTEAGLGRVPVVGTRRLVVLWLGCGCHPQAADAAARDPFGPQHEATDLHLLKARRRVSQDPSELGDLERSFDRMALHMEERAQELETRARALAAREEPKP